MANIQGGTPVPALRMTPDLIIMYLFSWPFTYMLYNKLVNGSKFLQVLCAGWLWDCWVLPCAGSPAVSHGAGQLPHPLHPASLSSAFRCGLQAERAAWWEPGGRRERAAGRHTAGPGRGAAPGSRLSSGPEAQCLPAPQLPPDHTSHF